MNEIKELNFINFLKILTKWRKFLFFNLLIGLIFAIILFFSLDKWYKASALIYPPTDQQVGSGISSILNSLPISALGINTGGTEQMTYIAILKSRTLALDIINKYNLKEFYEEETIEETLKDFWGDFDIQQTDENMISISYEYTDSIKAAEIVNYIILKLGKMSNSLMLQRAERTKGFLEKRYLKNLKDIDSISTELKDFQEKYGIIEFEEQTKALINSTAEIEAQIYLKEAELDAMRETLGENSVQYKTAKVSIESLKDELNKLKFNPKSGSASAFSSLYIPFEKIPSLGKKYFKLYSDLTIQGKLQEFILPEYEQAKLQLLKDKPSLQVIDYAVPPDKKSKPKGSFIVGGVLIIVFFLSLFIILIIEHLKWLKENDVKKFDDVTLIKNSLLNFFRKQ